MQVIKSNPFPPWKEKLLKDLHRQGKDIRQICGILGMKRERVLVKCSELGLELIDTPPPKKKYPAYEGYGPPAEKKPDVNLAELAEQQLAGRLTYKRGMRLLDGRPATFDEMMAAWNRQRRMLGQKPMGNKREWL